MKVALQKLSIVTNELLEFLLCTKGFNKWSHRYPNTEVGFRGDTVCFMAMHLKWSHHLQWFKTSDDNYDFFKAF